MSHSLHYLLHHRRRESVTNEPIGLRAALRQLGVHDVYHMQTTAATPSDIPYWMRAIDAKYGVGGKGHFGRKEWDELLATHQV